MLCVFYFFYSWFIWRLLSPASKKKKSSRSSLPEMTSSANFNRQSYVPYHSLSIAKYALAHNSIAFFNTILSRSISNANSHCYARNVPAMPTGKGGWEGIVWKPVMQLWASACGDWQWMVRHITLSIEIGWCHISGKDDQEDFLEAGISNVPKNTRKKCLKIYETY